jgi:PST family polysaccharide transporter
MMMLLPFAIQQAFDPARTGKIRKWLPVILIGASAPTTISRTSVIGLIIVLLLLVPTWPPQRRWPAVGVGILALGAIKVITPGLIGTLTGLFSALFNGGDSSTQARTMDYAGVFQYVAERPWSGRGLGTFIPSLYRFTDNMYLLALVEIGILGVLALLVLIITMLHCGGAGRRRFTDPSRRELGQSFVAAGAVALVSSATFDTFSFTIFGGVFFLLLGCAGAYLGLAYRLSTESDTRPDTGPAWLTAVGRIPTTLLPTVWRRVPAAAPVSPVIPAALPAGPAAPQPPGSPPPGPEPTGPEHAGPQPPALGRRVAKATRWSLLNTIVIRLGTFATGIVLARFLLTPRDYGLYAVGLVALTVLLSANEMGVSLAMVRWEGDVRRFAPTVLTLSLASSSALYGVFYLAAPTAARLLGSADATNVLRVLCFSVVIDGIACVPNGFITREFRQVTRMVLDLANFLVGTGVTVTLAMAHFGAMSFAWGSIAGNLVGLTGAILAAPGLLRFGWNPAQARALLRFGLPLAGASLLVLAMLSVDSAVVGATLGPAALGLYQVAFNVSSWPVRIVSDAARRVSFAGFSRIADSRRSLSDGFCLALRVLLTVAVPAAVVLGVLAGPVINTIYGPTWAPAALALQFLAILGLLRVGFELSYDCLMAAGRRRDVVLVQGLWLAALIPALILLARQQGIAGVGLGHVLVAGLLVAPAFLVALTRAGISLAGVGRAAAAPLGWGALATGAAVLVHQWTGDGLLGLIAPAAAAGVAYAPILVRLRRLLRRPSTDPEPAPPTDEPAVPVPASAFPGGD